MLIGALLAAALLGFGAWKLYGKPYGFFPGGTISSSMPSAITTQGCVLDPGTSLKATQLFEAVMANPKIPSAVLLQAAVRIRSLGFPMMADCAVKEARRRAIVPTMASAPAGSSAAPAGPPGALAPPKGYVANGPSDYALAGQEMYLRLCAADTPRKISDHYDTIQAVSPDETWQFLMARNPSLGGWTGTGSAGTSPGWKEGTWVVLPASWQPLFATTLAGHEEKRT